jgi:ribosomal protein S18 acetylase RimI-like enzyme
MANNLRIRPATPEDGPLAADLIFSTGPDLFDFVFYRNKENTSALINRLFAEETNSLSHSCAYMAELGGRSAGLVHVVDFEEKKLGNRTLGGSLVRHMGWVAFLIRTPRFLTIDRLIPEIGNDTYYIQHLATRERFRGQGVGRGLLEFCETIAARRRLGSLALDVESGNAAAIRFYRSFGFKISRKIESRVLRRKYDFEGLYRMIKEI